MEGPSILCSRDTNIDHGDWEFNRVMNFRFSLYKYGSKNFLFNLDKSITYEFIFINVIKIILNYEYVFN